MPSTCAERIKTLSNLLQLSDHQNNGAARLKSISYNASVGGTSVSSEINPASTTTTTNTAAAAAAAKMHRPAQKRKSGDGVMGMDAVSVEAHQFPEITPPKTKHLKGSGIAFGGGVGGLNSWHSAKNTTTTTAAAAAGLKRSTSNPAVDNLHSQHHLNEQSHRQQRTMSSTSVFQQPKQNQSLTRSNSSSSILPSSNTTTNNNNNSSSSSFENNSNNTSRTTKMFVGDNSSLVPKAPPIQTKSTSAAGPHVVNNNKIPLARAKSNTFSTTIKSTSALSLVPTGSSQQPLLSQSARSSGGKATIAKRLGMTHRNPTSLISATTTTNNNRDSLSSITSSSASPAESKPVSSSKKTLLRRKL